MQQFIKCTTTSLLAISLLGLSGCVSVSYISDQARLDHVDSHGHHKQSVDVNVEYFHGTVDNNVPWPVKNSIYAQAVRQGFSETGNFKAIYINDPLGANTDIHAKVSIYAHNAPGFIPFGSSLLEGITATLVPYFNYQDIVVHVDILGRHDEVLASSSGNATVSTVEGTLGGWIVAMIYNDEHDNNMAPQAGVLNKAQDSHMQVTSEAISTQVANALNQEKVRQAMGD